ncbi:MAG TPA: acyl-CoA dehydrogenase family protein [Acidimicrobiales bacterium]|nr:acyl-CoA dehydrogenase family protein [Acidimicrobiales bacterium]
MATVEASADEAVDLQDFRARVAGFLEANAAAWRQVNRDEDDILDPPPTDPAINEILTEVKKYQAALFDAGLAGLTWPKEYGGQGLPSSYQQAFNEEAARYDLPLLPLTIGFGMCGPTILAVGTEAQKQRYIRPLLRADEVWCLLFSEPGAGSDVASLQTRAVLDGDEFVVNGQKVWTSGAHYSDFGALLARTDVDVPKHRGLTMMIVDMHSLGITTRPLRQMNGGANFNEVFFDGVRVPASNVLGHVNEGWSAAITMLMNERVAIGAGGATSGARRAGGGVRALITLARARGANDDPVMRQRLADLYIRQRVQDYLGLRIRSAVRAGRDPGPQGSIAKLAGAELGTRLADVAVSIAALAAQAWLPADRQGGRWSTMVTSAPGGSLAGGTNEVQRNIIGERVLGLPREPQVDRDVPFRDLLVGTQGRS